MATTSAVRPQLRVLPSSSSRCSHRRRRSRCRSHSSWSFRPTRVRGYISHIIIEERRPSSTTFFSSSSARRRPLLDTLTNTVLEASTSGASSSGNSTRIDWDDRIALQKKWSNAEKGWQVDVEWLPTAATGGVGLFARQDVPEGTVLRVGVLGVNLLQFRSIRDIRGRFLDIASNAGEDNNSEEYRARVRYVKDYLWGFDPIADERGYPVAAEPRSSNEDDEEEEEADRRFLGMWIPGNGLNHSSDPNTVYRSTDHGIDLVALEPIKRGEELYDDYRRHGSRAPDWLRDFARNHGVTLNFQDCNDFVV